MGFRGNLFTILDLKDALLGILRPNSQYLFALECTDHDTMKKSSIYLDRIARKLNEIPRLFGNVFAKELRSLSPKNWSLPWYVDDLICSLIKLDFDKRTIQVLFLRVSG